MQKGVVWEQLTGQEGVSTISILSVAAKQGYEILENIARQLGYKTFAVDTSVTGTIYLITERPPCKSCRNVIEKFKEMFSNVM